MAAQIWVICHGVASIYKLAYDREIRDLHAGVVLSARLTRHPLDDAAVKEVDYLTGDDRYKRDWMSHCRERWGIVEFSSGTARGLMEGVGKPCEQLGTAALAQGSPARPRHRMTGPVRTTEGPRAAASFARSVTA